MQDPRDIFSFAAASKQLLAALAEAAVHLQLNPALVEKLTIPSNSGILLQVVGSLAKYIKGGYQILQQTDNRILDVVCSTTVCIRVHMLPAHSTSWLLRPHLLPAWHIHGGPHLAASSQYQNLCIPHY
jgi:hypothetical protein